MIGDRTAAPFDVQVDSQFPALQGRVGGIRCGLTVIVPGERVAASGRRDQFEGVAIKLLASRNRYAGLTAESHRAQGSWSDVSRAALPCNSDGAERDRLGSEKVGQAETRFVLPQIRLDDESKRLLLCSDRVAGKCEREVGGGTSRLAAENTLRGYRPGSHPFLGR